MLRFSENLTFFGAAVAGFSPTATAILSRCSLSLQVPPRRKFLTGFSPSISLSSLSIDDG